MSVNGERQVGKVKWFDPAKGYGFIHRAEGGEDVFVHWRDLEVPPDETGRKNLDPDEVVSFGVAKDDRGRDRAVEVRLEA